MLIHLFVSASCYHWFCETKQHTIKLKWWGKSCASGSRGYVVRVGRRRHQVTGYVEGTEEVTGIIGQWGYVEGMKERPHYWQWDMWKGRRGLILSASGVHVVRAEDGPIHNVVAK